MNKITVVILRVNFIHLFVFQQTKIKETVVVQPKSHKVASVFNEDSEVIIRFVDILNTSEHFQVSSCIHVTENKEKQVELGYNDSR